MGLLAQDLSSPRGCWRFPEGAFQEEGSRVSFRPLKVRFEKSQNVTSAPADVFASIDGKSQGQPNSRGGEVNATSVGRGLHIGRESVVATFGHSPPQLSFIDCDFECGHQLTLSPGAGSYRGRGGSPSSSPPPQRNRLLLRAL